MAWKLTPAGRGGSTHPPKGPIGGATGSKPTSPAKGAVRTAPLGTSSTKPISKTGKQGKHTTGSF